MSDTLIFIRRRWSPFFSIGLYVITSICLVIGAAMYAMKPADWADLSTMQKWGWALLLIGNVTNTWKAATSKSTRQEPTQ